MPKKFKGENSKAVEARARKSAAQEAEKERKDREKEDALWQDDDKHIAKKQHRKDEKEKKKQEQVEKKQQLKQLYDEEMAQAKGKPAPSAKVTRAELEANRERLAAAAAAAPTPSHDELPLMENVNRLQTEGDQARSVEEAISLLSTQDAELDKHPEKRMKAAYQKFENDNLPRLKQENPNMRLSQLKQLLKKDWMKSPDNPLNQRHIAYNVK